MEYLTILDFSTGEVDIYPTDNLDGTNIEELLRSLGHNASNCQWMFGACTITFHNEVLV